MYNYYEGSNVNRNNVSRNLLTTFNNGNNKNTSTKTNIRNSINTNRDKGSMSIS